MKTLQEYLQDGWRFHHEQTVIDTLTQKPVGEITWYRKRGEDRQLVHCPEIDAERERIYFAPVFQQEMTGQ